MFVDGHLEHKCMFLKMALPYLWAGGRMPELELCKFGSNLLHKLGPRIFRRFKLLSISTRYRHLRNVSYGGNITGDL
jgi:hypothetical protein